MTPADLSRLETLAREATPGPWEREGTVVWSPMAKAVVAGASNLHPDHDFVKYSPPTFRDIDGPAANAAYIAAANPAAVLALIERVRAVERLHDLEAELNKDVEMLASGYSQGTIMHVLIEKLRDRIRAALGDKL